MKSSNFSMKNWLRHKKIGGLILGVLLVGGAGYQLRREEDFKKALAKLV
ncbi:hypothetical protein ABID29_001548 [Streptococcus rupicaprae]|uniref:Uncharacterized protein n=1 Tax=Streptococcus rupicaprae TaxID=759619 RepID=A0ABV2FIR1_9STRE